MRSSSKSSRLAALPRGLAASPERRFNSRVTNLLSVYSLPIVLVCVIGLFSILLPSSFPTTFNLTSLLSTESVAVLLALAVMVPMAANHFNLAVGYQLGLSVILLVGLQTKSHMPWGEAALIVLGISVLLGLANGLLITEIGMDSFIVTLGSGTIVYGISLWYTGGQQLTGLLSSTFIDVNNTIGPIPIAAIIAFVIAFLLWALLEYTTIGRFLYALGANPRAAHLVGISARRYVVLAFLLSSLITVCASIILGSQLQVGQPAIGPDYLLPAFAGAFFGASSIKPGRVNVWGTVIAVMLLAIVVSGLEQEGLASWVSPLFNGVVLIIAVGLALIMERRRENRSASASTPPIATQSADAPAAEESADVTSRL